MRDQEDWPPAGEVVVSYTDGTNTGIVSELIRRKRMDDPTCDSNKKVIDSLSGEFVLITDPR